MNIRTILTLGLLTAATGSFAQTEIPAPEFKNKVYFVNADNTLADLDNTDMQSDMQTGMTSAKIRFRVAGKAAAIKHSGATNTHYIVKLDDGIDPEAAVELFKFDTDKKSRSIIVGNVVMGSMKVIELPKQKLSFTKLANGAYLISSKEALSEGEYGFIVNRPAVSLGGGANAKTYAFEVAGGE